MDVQVQAEGHAREEVSFLTQWEHLEDSSRREVAGIVSLVLHVAGFLLLAALPASQPVLFRIGAGLEKSTPLVAPPPELTQTAPNREKVGKEFTLENLLPKPRIFIPPSAGTALPPPSPKPLSAAIPEPPKIETPQGATQLPPAAGAQAPPPPPQIQAQERPRIALENVGTPSGTGTGQDQPKAKPPSTSVDEAAHAVARSHAGGTAGMVVGDLDLNTGAGIGGGVNLPPSPGRTRSAVELMSDPMGVDFHPYLIQILATVKRYWWSVIPQSASMGRQSRTVVCQFAINRDGSVPKLVIAVPSGTQALDFAAVSGIAASNPFPPLPRDFKGEQIRLQFTFVYNAR